MRFRTLVLVAAALAAALFGAWRGRQAYLAASRRAEAWTERQRIEATEAALDTLIELPDRQLVLDELAERRLATASATLLDFQPHRFEGRSGI